MLVMLRLFFEFFKTGLFAVGGGLATLPFLREMAIRTNWFNAEDIANMVAVSESTPGAIGINMSTYVGFTTAANNGLNPIIGGIVSTLGLAAPCIIVIIIIAHILKKFKDSPIVKSIFTMLRPASMALITVALIQIAEIALLNAPFAQAFNTESITAFWNSLSTAISWKGISLGLILFYTLRKFKKHPIVYIAAAAVVGILFQF